MSPAGGGRKRGRPGGKPGGRSRPSPGRRPARSGSTGRSGSGGRAASAGRGTGRARSSASRGLGGEQVEGRQAVRELLLAGRRKVHEVIVAAGRDDAGGPDELARLAAELGVPVREVARSKFDSLAGTEAPQGVIARAAPVPEADLDDLTRSAGGPAPFLVALDGITDPGNLGAVLRSAECAGATGAVLPRHRAVHLTPAATKAAAGAIEHLPLALVGGLPTALSDLRSRGVWVVGLDAAGTQPVHELSLADEPVALVVGSEGRGLARLTRERCDVVVNIPLHGHLDALNASAAAAIACFEVARRRHP